MSNIEREQTQVYRVSLSVDIKVCGGNDKGRRISAEEYVHHLIFYRLYEDDGGPESQGVGWHGTDYSKGIDKGEHAPYQMDNDLYNVDFKSIRKVGPIKHEDNSNRWSKEEENKEGHPE
jgi:hypothetical protein